MKGIELRKYRRGVLDMTQIELADRLHLSERTISTWENTNAEIPMLIELAVKSLAVLVP